MVRDPTHQQGEEMTCQPVRGEGARWALACAMVLGGVSAQAADYAGLQVDLSVMSCDGSTQAVVIDPTQMRCEGRWVLGTGTVVSTQPLLIRGRLGVDLRGVTITAPELRIESAGDINVGPESNLDAHQVGFSATEGQAGGVLTVAAGVVIANQSSGLAVRSGPGEVMLSPDVKVLPVDLNAGTVVVRTDGDIGGAAAPGAAQPAASGASAPTAASDSSAATAGATPSAIADTGAAAASSGGGGAWNGAALLGLAAGMLALCAWPQRQRTR